MKSKMRRIRKMIRMWRVYTYLERDWRDRETGIEMGTNH